MASDLFSDLPDAGRGATAAPSIFDDLPSTPSRLQQFMRNQPTSIAPRAAAAPQQPTPIGGGWLGREVEGLGAGAFRGLASVPIGAAELVGEGLKAAGLSGAGGWVADKARQANTAVTAATAPDIARAPAGGAVGEVLSYLVGPGRAIGAVDVGRPVVNALAQGALAGVLQPTSGQDFWRQKAAQAAIGGAAGAGTHLGFNALARMVAPNLTGARGLLFGEGVNLTPGQVVGGVARSVEDRATSLPLVGDAIQGARRAGIEDFNRAAINRTLAPIGEALPTPLKAGRAAIDYAHQRLSDAYDKLLPKLRGEMDPELYRDINGVLYLGGNLPEAQQRQLDSIVKNEIEDRFTAGGVTSGRSLKDIESELGRIARENTRSPDYDVRRLGTAVQELQASVRRMVERVNPGQRDALAAINEGWAGLLRVERAAGSVGAKDGIFTPAQLSSAVKAFDTSRNKSSFARGDAMMQDLADAAQSVLPSTVPDSGTAGRMLLGALAGGGGVGAYFGHPAPLLGLGAAALPYSTPGMALMRNYLAAAPVTRNALADIVRSAGATAAPGAAMLAVPGTNP